MKLKDLAAKPTLLKVVVEKEAIVKAYGEPLEFYMWDRQDLPTFLQLATMRDDPVQLFEIIRKLVLDEDGKPVLEADDRLPVDIMVPVIETVVERLTNFTPKTSAA